jgi:hypothetical protein
MITGKAMAVLVYSKPGFEFGALFESSSSLDGRALGLTKFREVPQFPQNFDSFGLATEQERHFMADSLFS